MNKCDLVKVSIFINSGASRITIVMERQAVKDAIEKWRTVDFSTAESSPDKVIEFHGRIDDLDSNEYEGYFQKDEIIGIDIMEPNKL